MAFVVEFYETVDGKIPIQDFLNDLKATDEKLFAKALHDIELLQDLGNALREPHSKALGEGLFELRIKFSSNIARVFYFFFIGNKIILTNGFIKKTQKTPKNEHAAARQYKQEYERRHQNT